LHTYTFRHEMLSYSGGADGFVTRALPLLSRAVGEDRPALVAIPRERVALLREALGEDAERVRFADMHSLGRNPGRIISAWHEFLAANAHSGREALGIGEPIWPGRSAAELTECHNHEALLNVAFGGGHPWRLVCPYDVDGLEDHVIEEAERSHAFIDEDGAIRSSDAYAYSDAPPSPFAQPLAEPQAQVRELVFTGDQLGALRRVLSVWAGEHQLGAKATEELVLAVNELATNSIRYGGGQGKLLSWSEGEALVCEIQDAGHIQNPLTGRSRPAPNEHTGRGLWLVHQLCDLVQIHSAASGTAVRVHKRRDGVSAAS
jgi:anti-sigma regulatory factor (Ser/Thr protein kinase)